MEEMVQVLEQEKTVRQVLDSGCKMVHLLPHGKILKCWSLHLQHLWGGLHHSVNIKPFLHHLNTETLV